MAETKQKDDSSIDLKKQSNGILLPGDKIVLPEKAVYLRLLYNDLTASIERALPIYNLGLDFSMTPDAIATLKFTGNDSLQKLKHACSTETIKDFLQTVFIESGAADILGTCNCTWKFFICLMSPEQYKIYSTRHDIIQKAKKEEEKQIWKLFSCELDPAQLFDELMKLDLIGEKDEDNMLDIIPRMQQMNFLIGRLVLLKGPDEGFRILLSHCIKYGHQYLCKKINNIYAGEAGNSNITGQRVENETMPGRKLFTADVRFIIQGPMKVDIDIKDTKWHFDTDEVLKDEIVIMQLIPDLESVAEKAITAEAVKEEIVSDVIVPDQELTEVKSLKTDEPCPKRMKSMHSDDKTKFAMLCRTNCIVVVLTCDTVHYECSACKGP